MDMSNKSLALLLVAAIVISLGGTLISLNKLGQVGVAAPGIAGKTTYAGRVNLSVTTTVGCSVDSNVSLGASGQPSSQFVVSSHNKNNGAGDETWNNCLFGQSNCGLTVNNTGNVDVELNFTHDQSGTSLGLGASADRSYFQYLPINGTDAASPLQPGCANGINNTGSPGWSWVPAANTELTMCANLTFDDANDIVTVDYNITVDPDADPGQKLTSVTVECTQN